MVPADYSKTSSMSIRAESFRTGLAIESNSFQLSFTNCADRSSPAIAVRTPVLHDIARTGLFLNDVQYLLEICRCASETRGRFQAHQCENGRAPERMWRLVASEPTPPPRRRRAGDCDASR